MLEHELWSQLSELVEEPGRLAKHGIDCGIDWGRYLAFKRVISFSGLAQPCSIIYTPQKNQNQLWQPIRTGRSPLSFQPAPLNLAA